MTDSANAGVLTVTTSSPEEQITQDAFLHTSVPALYTQISVTSKKIREKEGLKHTVGYRCPEVLDLEDIGSGIVISVKKKKQKIAFKYVKWCEICLSISVSVHTYTLLKAIEWLADRAVKKKDRRTYE